MEKVLVIFTIFETFLDWVTSTVIVNPGHAEGSGVGEGLIIYFLLIPLIVFFVLKTASAIILFRKHLFKVSSLIAASTPLIWWLATFKLKTPYLLVILFVAFFIFYLKENKEYIKIL